MLQYDDLGEEVRAALEEVLRERREAEEQTIRILDAEGLEEAKQLYLIHQVCIVQREVMVINRSIHHKYTSVDIN